ncbi:alpha/beta hydrolase [Sulfolobales archaeon HS-7]|nr:alpha/beta hydrolase [Sulfolobales archaeon HS-7]
MKILVIHGLNSSPEKIEWLSEPLRKYGEVYVPKVDEEIMETVEKYSSFNCDLVAGHSRGGASALILGSKKVIPVIAVSPPADRLLQLHYLSTFPSGTPQHRNYEYLSSLGEEYLRNTSPINYVKGLKDVLLIHGTRDDIVQQRQSEILCEKIRESGGRCQLQIIDMKHSPMRSQYKEIDNIISEWLNSLNTSHFH